MTNAEAIKLIKAERRLLQSEGDPKEFPSALELAEALGKAIKALEVQEWIPVSERLPEDEYVLISKMPTKISGGKWSVAIAIRTADPRSRKIQWRDSGFGVIQDDKVLAWKPLPEPYQEDTDE